MGKWTGVKHRLERCFGAWTGHPAVHWNAWATKTLFFLSLALAYPASAISGHSTSNRCLTNATAIFRQHNDRIIELWDYVKQRPELSAYLYKLPEKYLLEPNLLLLAWDTDREKISPDTVREAVSILEAVERDLVAGPVTRARKGTGADFVTSNGVPVDIKTPKSPKLDDPWKFDGDHLVETILKRIMTHGDTVYVLDVTYLSNEHRAFLVGQLLSVIPEPHKGRLVVLDINKPGFVN